MSTVNLKSNPKVEKVFSNYPPLIRDKMMYLRTIVLQTAQEMDEISEIEETLKWGEPSYLTKKGSTLRMDWKPKTPNQYFLYFKCTSRLVETFKEVFGSIFNYEGNRAIIFQVDEQVPINEVKECIKATLFYHKVKRLPYLGLNQKKDT